MGAGVWKRVRLKLEGRDESAAPSALKRHSPHEQVPYTLYTSSEPLNLTAAYLASWVEIRERIRGFRSPPCHIP